MFLCIWLLKKFRDISCLTKYRLIYVISTYPIRSEGLLLIASSSFAYADKQNDKAKYSHYGIKHEKGIGSFEKFLCI
jgi:hypothetical protein